MATNTPTAIIAFALVLATGSGCLAAAWQYEVPFQSERGAGRAALWIPPQAGAIRGLLLSGEGECLIHPLTRQAAVDCSLGIVHVSPHVGGGFHFWKDGDTCGPRLLKALDDLAERTGHPEIRRVPWITMGHSTAGIYCRNVAYWQPERVAGVIHYKSGNFHAPGHLPPTGSLVGVPLVAINGQYETFGPDLVEKPDAKDKRLDERYGRETQWTYVRADIQKFRAKDPNHLMSELLDPGGDHFFGSQELWAYTALFIRKTAKYRIPAELAPGDGPVKCLPLKAEDGWLSDPDLKKPQHKPAAYKDYTGGKSDAFWHYDEETALATMAHHRNLATPQCLSNPVGTFLDEGDGWTFAVKAQWQPTLPASYCGPLAGQEVGHSDAPFVYRCQLGVPVTQIGPDKLRVLRPAKVVHIAAVHPGDAKFRATNRWGNIEVPVVKGEKQTITFPAIGEMRCGGDGVELKATASSGLPIHYEVDYGPAEVKDGRLVISELPVNPKLPIQGRVTAYQIGRRTGQHVEAAAPVQQMFSVVP